MLRGGEAPSMARGSRDLNHSFGSDHLFLALVSRARERSIDAPQQVARARRLDSAVGASGADPRAADVARGLRFLRSGDRAGLTIAAFAAAALAAFGGVLGGLLFAHAAACGREAESEAQAHGHKHSDERRADRPPKSAGALGHGETRDERHGTVGRALRRNRSIAGISLD